MIVSKRKDDEVKMNNPYLLNSFWVICASVFVFMMQMGFACCEAGFARSKNAANIWLKNLCDFLCGALAYYFIGFGLMYGQDWHGLIGINGFINPLNQDLAIWHQYAGTLSPQAFLLFQTMFCATTATIISGSVAERFKFSTYLITSTMMTAFIYPIIGHWIWGGGWLSQIGFTDFAGSAAVHSVGGIAALCGAIAVGPRIGKYTGKGKNTKSHAIPGHNIPMAMLGGLILWVGWYGFNPGLELALDDVTFYTAITTTFAGAAGGLAALFFTWARYKKPDPTLALNGALAGLVAICSGVAEVSYIGSICIGIIAAILLVLSVEFVDHKLHVDDPAGAISLHGCSGITGTILCGLFSTKTGLFYGHGGWQLLIQFTGIVSVVAFAAAACSLMFFILKHTIGVRVPAEVELEGLDVHEHGLQAYAEDSVNIA